MRKEFILPVVVIFAMVGGYALLNAHLASQDTTLPEYLSGLMLNFYGGEQDQLIRVNLHNFTIALYEKGNLYKFSHIAGAGNPNGRSATPTGKFRILSKDVRHISGLSGVIMPLSMRFYEGYFFHDIPLYPNGKVITTKYSGGCIRLPTALATEMYAWVNVGAYVEIFNSSLAKADDSDTVYLLTEDGYKQAIPNERVFAARGYKWSDVAVVPAAELAAMPSGGSIQ